MAAKSDDPVKPKDEKPPPSKVKDAHGSHPLKRARGGKREGAGRPKAGTTINVGGTKMPRQHLIDVTAKTFKAASAVLVDVRGPHWSTSDEQAQAIGAAFLAMAEAYGWLGKALPPWAIVAFVAGPWVARGVKGDLAASAKKKKAAKKSPPDDDATPKKKKAA